MEDKYFEIDFITKDADSIREILNRQLCHNIVSGQEDIVRRAIAHKLGTEEFDIYDIRKRGKFVTTSDKKVAFYFDGERLVEFFSVEFNESGGKMIADQHYRVLYK